MRLAKCCGVGQNVMSNMICYMWLERVLYADYDNHYIINILTRVGEVD